MKIEIRKNLNIFYVYTILNLIGYDDDNGRPFHPIREKIREDLKYLSVREEFIKLKDLYNKEEIYPYWLVYIAFHSDDGFKNYKPQVEYVKDNEWYDAMLELLPTIKEIITKYKLEEYYINNLQDQFLEIINKLQNEVDKFPLGDELNEYWGVEIEGQGIVFPNPLEACHRAWGGNIAATLLAARGPSFRGDTVMFNAEEVIQNALHEFSHTYGERIEDNITLLWTKEYQKKGKLLYTAIKDNLKILGKESLMKNYNNMDTFLDEIIVRASEIGFLTPAVFKKFWANEVLEEEVGYKLSNVKDQGFIFIDEVIEEISVGKKEKLSMEKIYVNVFMMLYKKFM